MICLLKQALLLLPWITIAVAQDGALDPSFGAGGLALLDTTSSIGQAIAVQADGKIVVGGHLTLGGGDYDMLVARFLPDGSPDGTFGTGGSTTVSFGINTEQCRAIVIQPDGKILVGGYGGNPGAEHFALARFEADGSLDAGFSGDGMVITPLEYESYCEELFLLPDGKILAAGRSFNLEWHMAAVRYTAAGALDDSYGDDGKAILDYDPGGDCLAHSATLRADGRLLLAGSVGPENKFAIACLNHSGFLYTSFGDNGWVVADVVPGWHSQAIRIHELSDGKILLAGVAVPYPITDRNYVLARYLPDGTLDDDFGAGGVAVTDLDSTASGHMDLIIQPDDRMLLCGALLEGSQFTRLMARFNADGTLDMSYGTDGIWTFDFGNSEPGHSLTLQADLKVVVAGYVSDGSTVRLAVTRHFTGMNIGILENTPVNMEAFIYPVPVTHTARIEYTLADAGVIDLELLDEQGRLISSLMAHASRPSGAHSETIDLSGLAAGRYTLVLRNGKGRASVGVVKE